MTRAKPVLVAIGAALLLFLTLGAWSLSSPVGSSPDDDFHLASIWCGQGERDGLCEGGSTDNKRLVPSKAVTAACFAFNSDVTASCQGNEYLDAGFTLTETSRVNTGNQYPGGFYLVTSAFASDNIAVATVSIRLFNSALFAVLTVGTWCLLPRKLRFTLAGSVALTFVPFGLFFVASTNPSSWAFTSGALLVPALLGWFATQGWRRYALGGISALAALIGVTARGDSGAYVVVAALAASVLAFASTKRYWLAALLPAALVITGALAFLTSGQTGLALSGQMGGEATEENPTSKIALAILNLLSLPSLWTGIYGQGWGLGWLDTDVPAIVPGILTFLCAGVLFVALRTMSWRRAIALAGVGAATIVVPIYTLVQSGALVGQEVQPRYILPLITMFVAAAIAPSMRRSNVLNDEFGWLPGVQLSKLQLWIIAVGISLANAVALFSNLRRNVTSGSYNLDGAAQWWWNAGPSPFLTLAIGVAAATLLMLLMAKLSSCSKPALEAGHDRRQRQEVSAY